MSDGEFDPEDYVDPYEKVLEARLAAAQARATLSSLTHCADCDESIPEARRAALPGVRLCVDCQQFLDERA